MRKRGRPLSVRRTGRIKIEKFLIGAFLMTFGTLGVYQIYKDNDLKTIWIPGLFLLVGIVFTRVSLTGFFKSGNSAEVQRPDEYQDVGLSRAPRILKAKSSPMIEFGVIAAVALFWNVIVGFLVIELLPESWGGGGEEDLLPRLFILPFVVVGLVLIGVSLRQFLALWSPYPQCTLEPGALRLGETGLLKWQFSGDTRRITKLVITLEGIEEATYSEGSNTQTDTSTFAIIPIIESSDFHTIRLGQSEVSLPEFTAPTFSAPNNKIIWLLRIACEIRHWPDMSRSYEIQVLPLDHDIR